MWLRTSRDCRTIPKYLAACADTTANAPLATPLRPPAKFCTLACNRPDLGRNGFNFAPNPATFARNRFTPARKRKTPKRKVESLGARRSSPPDARLKRLLTNEKPSRPTRKASRATLRTLSMRGREGWTRRSEGWAQSMKPCVRRLGRCAQGLGGSGLGLLGLRVGKVIMAPRHQDLSRARMARSRADHRRATCPAIATLFAIFAAR